MKAMRAWRVSEWCDPEGMEWAELDAPAPGKGQVRLRNHAAALNFFDILQIQGKYQVKPPFPFTPGAEVSGIVDAVGEGVNGWKLGDAAIGLPEAGGFAEHTIVSVDRLFHLPKGMSWEQAAAFPIVYQTSLFALRERAHLAEGEWLLVHAGASGVGMSAIQIGKAMGARVIATAGSAEKLAFAQRQGADHVLDYSDPSWIDHVKSLSGGLGADVIYDPVGGDIFDGSSKCIAPYGRLLVIGFAAGRIPAIAANRILLKNIAVVGAFWGGHVKTNPSWPAVAHATLEALWDASRIFPEVRADWSLDQLPAAMAALSSRSVCGKAVVRIG
jgi:NADPH2:quinone reductase